MGGAHTQAEGHVRRVRHGKELRQEMMRMAQANGGEARAGAAMISAVVGLLLKQPIH